MAVKAQNYELHDFYCVNCGKKGLPIARAGNNFKKSGHRKLLYCPNCKHTVNHVECRTPYEVEEFLTAYNNGEFKEEASDELRYEAERTVFSPTYNGGRARKR